MKGGRQREREITDKNMLTEPISIFSAATIDAKRQQDNIFQNAKENNKNDVLCKMLTKE